MSFCNKNKSAFFALVIGTAIGVACNSFAIGAGLAAAFGLFARR